MRTRVIYNDILLDRIGFIRRIGGITLWPFIILREKNRSNKVMLNHEMIHIEQQKELLVVFFYIWYFVEFILKVFNYPLLSFEKECYKNQLDLKYLATRRRYSFLKYIGYEH